MREIMYEHSSLLIVGIFSSARDRLKGPVDLRIEVSQESLLALDPD